MIQAMVWAFVPTSGAGMSRSGPMMPSSSVAKRRVSARALARSACVGSQVDAALGAAERDVDQGALPGHPHRQRPDFVEVGRRVVAQAALGRAARDVVLDAVAR